MPVLRLLAGWPVRCTPRSGKQHLPRSHQVKKLYFCFGLAGIGFPLRLRYSMHSMECLCRSLRFACADAERAVGTSQVSHLMCYQLFFLKPQILVTFHRTLECTGWP